VYICDRCNRVVAKIENGELILKIRHDKEQHETAINLMEMIHSLGISTTMN
jgi:hypothetical protein